VKLDLTETLACLRELQAQMGVDVQVDLPDIDWEQLEGAGIDVDASEISADREGVLRYEGQAVAVYIREQHVGPQGQWSRYKFHLADCNTIHSMRLSGREERYTVTARMDGRFECSVGPEYGTKRRQVLRMQLCKNCLRKLDPPAYDRLSSTRRDNAVRNFDLHAHFYTYQDVGRSKPVPEEPPPPPDERYVSLAPRRDVSVSSSKPALTLTIPLLPGLPDWVPEDTDHQFKALLLHIDQHGSISEGEAAEMVGGARRLRRFARAVRLLTRTAPYRIERHSQSGISQFRRVRR